MNRISNAIKCKNCFSILKRPVLLPCEHAICKHHVDDDSPDSESIMCNTCEVTHKIPPGGFLQMLALNEIIEAELDRLYLGPVHEASKKSCTDLESLLVDLDSLLNDPCHYTIGEIGNLKNAVQIKREQLKLKIDEETDKLMKNLDDYQEKCNLYLLDNEYKEECNRLKELKKSEEIKLDEWKVSLDKLKFDEDKWTRIKTDSDAEIQKLTATVDELKKNLLLKEFENHKNWSKFFEKINIENAFEYISAPKLSASPFKKYMMDSAIIQANNSEEFFKLCGFEIHDEWSLLYRATMDGFEASQFHAKCDDAGETLTIIETTNGYIFGGYTSVSWKDPTNENGYFYRGDQYRHDSKAFIFSFKNPNNSPTKIPVSQPTKAIICRYNLGPCFGYTDILIFDSSRGYISNSSKLGHSYSHSNFLAAKTYSQSFLAGSYNFQVAEIEVFNRIQ